MTTPVSQLQQGDMVDLEGVDSTAANREIWRFEYAMVERVSTHDNPSGGWADYLLTPTLSVIYLENGAVPALVPSDAVVEIADYGSPDFVHIPHDTEDTK